MCELNDVGNLHFNRPCLSIPLVLLTLLLVFTAPTIYACSVPVFRYALERWGADAYMIEVIHHRALSGEAKAAANLLNSYANGEQASVNLTVRYVDAEKEIRHVEDARQREGAGPDQPQMTVYFPLVTYNREPFWRRPLTKDAVKKLVDSPLRKDIARQLLGGDSVVWILLESGNRQKDDEAAELLQEQLNGLQDILKLPGFPTTADENISFSENALMLRPAFSLVHLRRDDSEEAFLVASLLRTEPGLLEIHEPMAFPVFGRGRVLYALTGRGINKGNIAQTCRFLCGPCACQVKAMNPGVDLLIAAGWDEVIEPLLALEEPLSRLTGAFPISASAEAKKTLTGEVVLGMTGLARSKSESELVGTVVLVLLGIVVLVIAAGITVVWRGNPNDQ